MIGLLVLGTDILVRRVDPYKVLLTEAEDADEVPVVPVLMDALELGLLGLSLGLRCFGAAMGQIRRMDGDGRQYGLEENRERTEEGQRKKEEKYT